MVVQGHHQISSRSSWTTFVAVCFALVVLLLISGTIVPALIPVYLKTRNVTPKLNQVLFNAIYASDVTDTQLLRLSDTNDLSNQMVKTIPHLKNSMALQSGQFLAIRAAAKKKREISKATMSCEQATGLDGDLFTGRYMLKYPPMCRSSDCEIQYLKKILNSIRKYHRRITVTMSFTNGETRTVQLAFCSFSMTDINTPSNCTPDTSTYIYLLDQDSNLFQFHPETLDVASVGVINCSTTAYPYSMAVQRDGKAWTLYTDGHLYTFDTKTGQCEQTSFLAEQPEVTLFGMHFARDESNDNERLYIASDSSNPPFRLATIDVDSLDISIISYYQSIYARAELTTTPDGRLFGLFEGTPFIIAELNRTNGEIMSQTTQSAIQHTSDSSHFAFAAYSSHFFLFVGNGSFTDIFLYDSTTQTMTVKKTISNGIVGAGFSTCLQRNSITY